MKLFLLLSALVIMFLTLTSSAQRPEFLNSLTEKTDHPELVQAIRITGARKIPVSILQYPHLEYIILRDGRMKEIPAFLDSLKKLDKIVFEGRVSAVEGLNSLPGITKLEFKSIADFSVLQASELLHVREMSFLFCINLPQISSVTDSLRVLSLTMSSSGEWTERDVPMTLRSITIQMSDIGDPEKIICKNSSLEKIDIDGYTDTLSFDCDSLPLLKTVNITNTTFISIKNLASVAGNLKEIILRKTAYIREEKSAAEKSGIIFRR